MQKLRNLFLVFCLFVPVFAGAQAVPDPVQFIISPEVPGPNQTVTIEAQGIGTFLGDATITWSQDGKVVAAGAGVRTYTFATGALGSITKIHLVIKSSTQGTIARDFIFRPAVVNLVWEADTTVPPLYAGKALYSAGSPLKVVALPMVIINGSRIAASSLSFQWTRGNDPVPGASGLGRSSFAFVGDELQNQEQVSVSVLAGGAEVARGAITIPSTAPQILLYERDPLRGPLWDQALPQGISLSGKEITIFAQPYYFSNISAQNGSLSYAWTLNSADTAGPDTAKGMLTLRQTGSGAGQASVGVTVQNNDNDLLVQSAQTLLQIVFGQQASGGFSSFFGL